MPSVKPAILEWARESSRYSLEEAAKKLGISDSKSALAAEKLVAYENGQKEPSRSLLLRMSKRYHRPLLTFYLDEPPRTGDRGEDFRTLPEQVNEIEDAYVDVLIRDIKARQITVRETLIDADEGDALQFVGSHTMGSGVEQVVAVIKQILALDINEYRNQANQKEAFKLLRAQAERAGIFVILRGNLGSFHTDIDVTVFRGFALSDDIAPFIVINDRDAESAWSFTLLHEIAHIVLGETGISGAFAEQEIEKFCNEVASEFLLPKEEFNEFAVSIFDNEAMRSEVSHFAISKKISSSHIAYRLFLRGDIDKQSWIDLRNFFREKWLEQRKQFKEKSSQTDGGPSFYVVKNYKLGALVGLVQRLTQAGSLTTTKAGMLLDVKPLKVHRLFEARSA